MKHLYKCSLLLLALLLPATASAYDFEVDGIYYRIKDGTNAYVTFKGFLTDAPYSDYFGEVAIPESVTYNGTTYSVTSIGYEAFYGCSGLTSVTIPNSITSIGDEAFYNCSGLTSVTIPNSVTSIGSSMFYGCSGLTSIDIPNSVTTIGNEAFSGCSSLTSVTIPNSVTSIGYQAFWGCRGLTRVNITDLEAWCRISFSNPDYLVLETNPLYYAGHLFLNGEEITNLVLPNTISSIHDIAFVGCRGLTSLEIPNSITEIGTIAFAGCSNLTSLTIGKSVTSIGSNAFASCGITDLVWNAQNCLYNGDMSTSSIERVSIGNEVLVLPDYFLYGSKITSLYIPNSVTTIGSSAFSNCSCLTSATIGKSVTAISGQVFESCSNLTSLYFNAENCSDFEESPFRDSPINTIVFGNNVQTVPAKIASGLKTVTNVIFGDSVNTIGKDAFGYCEGLTSVTIPNSVTTIDDVAFQCCSGLTSVNIGNSVITIGLGAFACCSGLTNITIPNSVTTIGNFAFYYCLALTSVTIPNSVTAIGNETFSSCNSLTGIIIPNSVTSISEDAFLGCCGLTNITVASGNPYYDSRDNCNAIIETASNSLILGCMNTVIPNSVTSISYEAFYDCRGLSSITIPNSVTSIENYAFSGCSGLNEIYSLALAPPTIDSYTFYDCYGATLFVPEDAYEAYKQAEYWKNFNCIVCIGAVTPGTIFVVGGIFYRALNANMASVIANEDVENYYTAEVVIPDSVTYEDQTFAVTGIENNAFSDCYELTSVVIPNSVTDIGEQAFQGCTGLTSVTIGSGVTAIGAKAFNYCNALETVKCLGTVPPVMASADCFSTAAYNRATLLVPRQFVETYQAADYWYKFAHIEGWGSAGRGDIDGDGVVSIRDVTTLIDAILNGNNEGIYFESADVNINGRLDIGDVTTIVDMLLNDIE